MLWLEELRGESWVRIEWSSGGGDGKVWSGGHGLLGKEKRN